MKHLRLLLLAGAFACGGNSVTKPPEPEPLPVPGKPALDPWLTVRVRNLMDTTTLVGRAHWHIYALLTGTTISLHGVSNQGAIGLPDVRLGLGLRCITIRADSVGQKLLALLAIADTTTEALTPDARADSLVNAWAAGSRTVPAGWKALFLPPTDAWDSEQFRQGHGLTEADPIKWGWDWTATGTPVFYERASSDTLACNGNR